MTALTKRCLFLLILFLTVSCAVSSPRRDTSAVRISTVPFYPQEDYQCGPASLAGVLNYWGIKVSPEDIARDIYSRTARGTLGIDMLLYANRTGLHALQYSGGWEDLTGKVREGYPMVVLVDYGLLMYESPHFMVIVGFDEGGVYANSGREEGIFIRKDTLLKKWEKTKFWTLLVRPKEGIHAGQ
ncbi:MAG: C39 family peptidase [Alphaproteobacteria bacterium]|uniref:C39 family peptidase n=1 Tax=Candidatus Nitrobium versatile TaxID=2884831 RepID=A0A953M1S0_9BACT|nr:C39 family peptidase [Candidatus Nitrobium versatile]